MNVLITGVAGTGKSALCKELRKRGYPAYDIEDIPGLFQMVDKRTGKPFQDYDNYDLEKVKNADWVCDKKKLEKLLRENQRDGPVFYCGVASNVDELLPLFDKVFLLVASEPVLRKRLSTRTSNDFGRTREVQDWIFEWKGWWEKKMKKKGAVIVDADKPLEEVAREIIILASS